MNSPAAPAPKTLNPWTQFAIDLGPLVLFFAVYAYTDIFKATMAFMIAMTAAIIYSFVTIKHVSPMLLFSGFMVLVLGGLTIWLHDKTFIKMKPTIYYATISAILAFGHVTGKPTLKTVLGNAYPELNEAGWITLGRNFAVFFLGMAILNEIVWRNSSDGFWLGFKLWGAMPLTFLFGALHIPMILKNSTPAAEEIDPPLPPVG